VSSFDVFGAVKPTDTLNFPLWGLEACGLASILLVAIWSLGIGFNFPFLVKLKSKWNLTSLVQFKFNFNFNVWCFPLWSGEGYGWALFPLLGP
jgi:hypothetical protein